MPSQVPTLNRRLVIVILSGVVAFIFAVSLTLSFFTIYNSVGNKVCPQYRFDPDRLVLTAERKSVDKSIVFYKTHKTGSSSISGILWRYYCESKQLNCFLPPFSNPGKTWDFHKLADRKYALQGIGTQNRTAPYDGWFSHTVRHNFINQIVTKGSEHSGVRYLSNIRSPVSRFRSAWIWYGHGASFFPHYKLLGTYSIAHPKLSLERFATLLQPSVCGPPIIEKSVHTPQRVQKDAHISPSSPPPPASPSSTISPDYNSWLYTLFSEKAELLLSWYVQYAARRFKYRTGLDATSEELTGVRSSDPTFPNKFQQLLDEVASGELFLLVCDRFEESLLVLRRKVLGLGDSNGVPTVQHGSSMDYSKGSTGSTGATNTTFSRPPTISSSLFHNFPMPELLHLRQKQQSPNVEPVSDIAAEVIIRLQPHDTALHHAASQMLDRYIALYYGQEMALFNNDLRQLRETLEILETICSTQSSGKVSDPHRLEVEQQQEMKKQDQNQQQQQQLCAQLRRDNRDLVRDAWRRLGQNVT